MKKKKPSRPRQQTPLWAGVPPAPPAARPLGAAPAVPSPQAPRRWAHLMALAEAIETAEEALRPVLQKLDAAFTQPYPPSEAPQVAALLDCYAAMQQQLVAALAPLRPKLEAAWVEQEAIWRAAEARGWCPAQSHRRQRWRRASCRWTRRNCGNWGGACRSGVPRRPEKAG